MEYRQLELFLAITERLNLSHAAEALNITQPGLSKSMHRLQRELGTRLYLRRGRGIELTESGHALARHVKTIQAQLAEARSEILNIAEGTAGHARIGAGPAWLSRYLPVAVSRVMGRHPNIRFTVDTGFPDRLIRRLRMGDLDVVIGALPENRIDPDLHFSRLSSDVMRVVGRKEHPLLRKRDRSLADYASQRWILPGEMELVSQRISRAFDRAGLPKPMIALETDSLSLKLATLRTTDCLSMTTSQVVTQAGVSDIVVIDHPQLQYRREAGIIRRRHDDFSPSIKLIVTELRKIAAKHGSI